MNGAPVSFRNFEIVPFRGRCVGVGSRWVGRNCGLLFAVFPDGGEDEAGEDGGADGVEDDVGELAGAAGEEALVELVAGGDEGGGEDGAAPGGEAPGALGEEARAVGEGE